MKNRLTIIALLCSSLNLAYAQSPGIVYPTAEPTSKSQASTKPANAASSPIAQAIIGAAKTVQPDAVVPVSQDPINPPVKFVDPRRLDLPKTSADQSGDSKPKPVKKISEKHAQKPVQQDVVGNEIVNADGSKVQVTKKSDGSNVIRAQVPSSVAQAEAMVNAQIPVPSFSPNAPQPSAQASLAQTAAQTSAVGKALESGNLPKWVTSGIERTSARNQITIVPGATEIVRIARNFPNRFQTPFDNAEVVTTDENLTHDGTGGSIIIATASDKPIGIFIQDSNSDRAIPLVLIPEDIPQRNIKLILDDSWGPPLLRNTPEQVANMPSAQSDYVDYVKSMMRALAKGDIPDGHALSPIQPEFAPNCQSPGLQMKLGQMLEGAKTRIAVYTAKNTTQSTVPFQEAGCYRTGVLAVSAFPRPVLQSGQDTEVYVIVRKDSLQESTSSKRRPTLVQQ